MKQHITDAEQSHAIMLIHENQNMARMDNGINGLQLNAELNKAAQWMAEHMAEFGFMGHVDNFNRRLFERVPSVSNYTSRYLGENVAVGYPIEDVVNGWMRSAGHRNNILNGNFIEVGIGYYHKPYAWEKIDGDNFDYQDYYCVVFGRP